MAETTTSEPSRLDTPTGAILGTAMLPPGKGVGRSAGRDAADRSGHESPAQADPAAQLASYADPTLPVMPALPDGIADFVRSLP